MFDNLTKLGYGIITFTLIIGVGTVLLVNFGGSVGCNTTGFTTFNSTSAKCTNGTPIAEITPAGSGYTNTNYLTGQLGSSGLAGWTPAIIAFSVGMLFLGAFLIKNGRNY